MKEEEEDSQELMEKHQLELMQKDKKDNSNFDEDEQKMKMDAFEAKLDKIKSQNEAFLGVKKPNKKKSEKNSESDDSSDEEK